LKKDKGYCITIFTVIIELIQSFCYLRLQLFKIYVQLKVITCVMLTYQQLKPLLHFNRI